MKHIKISVLLLLYFTLLLGIVYPVFMWGVGQLFFHNEAGGSLVQNQGKVIGSSLIGQNFTSAKYFHPRPSNAGKGYDATNSGGSNLGPTSKKLIDAVQKRVADYRTENNWTGAVPADAVTGSGSGLDPHISVENALIQATRIATARSMTEEQLRKLIDAHTEHPTLGLFGEKRVNVLAINLALEQP